MNAQIKLLIFEGQASKPHEIHANEGMQFIEVIEQLRVNGHLVGEVILLEAGVPLGLNACVERRHHEHQFHSRIHEKHRVSVTINGPVHETHRGKNSVKHLRHIGNVPDSDDVFSQEIKGEFVPLDNSGYVEICGGEIFASHPSRGGSS